VMAQEAVGGVQARLGVLGGHGDGAGGVKCLSCVSARWGRCLVLCEVEIDYRGSRAVPGRRVEGEGDALAGASGSPSSLDAKRKRQADRVF
jgi:hypothetical protein